MCVAVPSKLVDAAGEKGLIDFEGVQKWVRLDLTPEAKPGDYIIVHAGYAIQVLDEIEARKTLSYLAEMAESLETK